MRRLRPKVLLIAYYFPPIKSIGALRSYQLARQWTQQAAKLHILTTTNRHRLQQDHLPLNGFTITEIPTFDYRTLLSLRPRSSNHLSEETKAHPLARLWLRLKDSFPTNILLDEGGPLYILRAYLKARRLLRQGDFDLLYSSFRPYADHLVAYLLKRRYPQLYWVADFRDLQVDRNRQNTYWPRLQHWFNRRILRRADRVITVSEGLAKSLRNYHDRVEVLRNGVELREPKKGRSECFSIVYTGSIYAGFQTPELLLEVLAELITEGAIAEEQLQIIYAGKDSHSWRRWIEAAGLGDCFVDRGLIARAEALQLQEEAQLNVLLSWSTAQQGGILTGKLYEYLGAQQPILLIIKGSQDQEFEALFEELQAGLVAYHHPDSKAAVRQYLLKVYREWQRDSTPRAALNTARLKQLSWSARAVTILDFLEQDHPC
ncbi:MAG: glycosyltransferase [Bacteroidota bacterium]